MSTGLGIAMLGFFYFMGWVMKIMFDLLIQTRKQNWEKEMAIGQWLSAEKIARIHAKEGWKDESKERD